MIEKYVELFKLEQIEKKSENTVSSYMTDLRMFLEYLESQKITLENINNQVIENYTEFLLSSINTKNGKNFSPVTINRKLITVKLFIQFVNSNEDFESKIYAPVKLLKVQKVVYLENLLEKSEFLRMIAKADQLKDEKAYTIFATLYYTGARISEMLQIMPQHINKDNLTIKGKGNKYREIILSDDIIFMLETYIKKHKIADNSRIFKMTRQTVHNIIKKYAGKCRINLKHASAHKFRHLYAIDLLENDATLEEVADALGHSDINTTRIYTKKTKKELKRTVNKLSLK